MHLQFDMDMYLFWKEALVFCHDSMQLYALCVVIKHWSSYNISIRNTKTITASTYRKYKPNGVIYQKLMHSSTQNERNICALNLIGSTSSQNALYLAHWTISKYCFVIVSTFSIFQTFHIMDWMEKMHIVSRHQLHLDSIILMKDVRCDDFA